MNYKKGTQMGSVILLEDANDTTKICPKVRDMNTGREFYMTVPHKTIQQRNAREMTRYHFLDQPFRLFGYMADYLRGWLLRRMETYRKSGSRKKSLR